MCFLKSPAKSKVKKCQYNLFDMSFNSASSRENIKTRKEEAPSATAGLLYNEPSLCSSESETHPGQKDKVIHFVNNLQYIYTYIHIYTFGLYDHYNISHSANHDKNIEELSWLLLFVHPAQEVVADDIDPTGLQAVFGLHHHVDAVRSQGWEPASEGLQACVNTCRVKVNSSQKQFSSPL